MYARILVAVDGSDVSRSALTHAITMARENGARLLILHVVDEVPLLGYSQYADVYGIEDTMIAAGRRILDKAAARASEAGAQSEVKLAEILGPGERVSDTIPDQARQWDAELIVVGTHGRRGLHHALLGSVAEGVVRLSSVPVLLIRNVASATNGSK